MTATKHAQALSQNMAGGLLHEWNTVNQAQNKREKNTILFPLVALLIPKGILPQSNFISRLKSLGYVVVAQ